jgi:hypothetical protein
MAVHWATGAVHVVPVFGESGALLEHSVFGLFYNWPLTIRSRMRRRQRRRAALPARRWHAVAWAIAGAAVMGAVEYFFQNTPHALPAFKGIALPLVVVPFFTGAAVTLGSGGAPLQKRIVLAAIAGALMGVLATGTSVFLGSVQADVMHLLTGFLWRVFLFTLFAAISAMLIEVFLPDRDGVL